MPQQKAHDQSQDVLVLNGLHIPVSGDGSAFASVEYEDRNAVTRAISATIVSKMLNPGATLTVTCYPEEEAHRRIADTEALRAAAPIRVPVPGSLALKSSREVHQWDDAVLTGPAAGVSSQERGTVSWVFQLVNARRVNL